VKDAGRLTPLRVALGLIAGVVCVLMVGILIALAPTYFRGRADNIEAARVLDNRLTGPPFDNGNILIGKLQAYQEAKGSYPDPLDKLVPEFIDRIPPPNWGANEWRYRSDGKWFGLGVRRLKDWYSGHNYSSETKCWGYDH
jgi:hypothetical protein